MDIKGVFCIKIIPFVLLDFYDSLDIFGWQNMKKIYVLMANSGFPASV